MAPQWVQGGAPGKACGAGLGQVTQGCSTRAWRLDLLLKVPGGQERKEG